jgi:hypothetical protein
MARYMQSKDFDYQINLERIVIQSDSKIWQVIYNLETKGAIQHVVDLCANFFLSRIQFSACHSHRSVLIDIVYS